MTRYLAGYFEGYPHSRQHLPGLVHRPAVPGLFQPFNLGFLSGNTLLCLPNPCCSAKATAYSVLLAHGCPPQAISRKKHASSTNRRAPK